MTQHIYYKVVKCDDNRLFSATVERDYPSIVLEYKVGEWTEAKIGGILVFLNIENAKELINPFLYTPSDYPIYSCEVEQELPLPKYGIYSDMLSETLMTKLWSDKEVPHTYLDNWPCGTFAFKRIKLMEKV